MKSIEQILREQIAELERLLELKSIRIIELESQISQPSLLIQSKEPKCKDCTCKK